MGKKSTESVETRLDPGAEAFRDYVYKRTKNVAGEAFTPYGGDRVAGLDPNTIAAFQSLMGGDANMMDLLRGGMGGLSSLGQPLNIGEFMDPYLNQVVGGVQGDFDRVRAASLRELGTSATHAGAFGGDRMALAQGAALGDIAREEGSVLGQLRSGGYQSAVQNALQNRSALANFGLSSAGMLNALQNQQAQAGIGLGEMQRGISQAQMDTDFGEFLRKIGWNRENLGLLQNTMANAPAGQTQTTTSHGNFLSTLGGIASIGASFLPGIGPAVGGLFGQKQGMDLNSMNMMAGGGMFLPGLFGFGG